MTFIAKLLAISLLFLGQTSFAQKLPHEQDTRKIKIDNIAMGSKIRLDFLMTLPEGQDLNRQAPSFLGIYEKVPSGWAEVKKLSLNRLSNFGGEFIFTDFAQLKSESSDVAIYATVYHCRADKKGSCYIQGFESIIKRNKKLKGEPKIAFSIVPDMK